MKPGDLLVVAGGVYLKETEPALISVPRQHANERVMSFPERVTPDLARFLGIFFADGSMHETGIRIACNAREPEWAGEVSDLGKRLFGIEPTTDNNGRGCLSVCFNSVQLLRWLYVNGLNKTASRDMAIPTVVRCFSRASLEAFIEGYWEADGSENKGTRVRYIDTASERMAQQLLVVLRALGRDAGLARMRHSGKGSVMYRVLIVKSKRRAHTVQVSYELHRLGLSRCSVERVAKIEDSESLTLDLEVPGTQSYIANSVVSHNTTSMFAGCSSGIEPLFALAFQHRVRQPDGSTRVLTFVNDAVRQALAARRLNTPEIQS